jgi:hypothetical protein
MATLPVVRRVNPDPTKARIMSFERRTGWRGEQFW